METALTIQLLQVDSLNANGFPARFKPESTYSAIRLRYLPAEETAVFLAEKNIPEKKIRTYRFEKNGKHYRWRAGAGNGMEAKRTISGFKLIPGRWYTTTFHARYGLLSDGYCTLLFTMDEQGKITCKRTDKVNDGPF